MTSLESLNLNKNELMGSIPECICNLNLTWYKTYSSQYYNDSYLYGNKFCPPYPGCLMNQEEFTDTNGNGIYEEDYVGYQDTSDCINIGDVNGDLEINILDVVTLVNIIMDDGEYTEYGDMNYDGYLNILDVVTLVNFILEP